MTREAHTAVLPATSAVVATSTLPRLRPAPGAWRYSAKKRSLGIYWLAVLVSLGFHVFVLFGFNRPPKVTRHVAVDDAIAVTLTMPDLKDLEEPEKPLNPDDMPPPDAGVPVPTLPDVPTQIDLASAFVQQIDFNSLVPPPDFTAAKTISIPTNIARGGRLGEGMANLFNLADLDHVPEPIVRVPPAVPASLRRLAQTVEVRVAFIVDTTGSVVSPVAVSSTNHDFEDVAVLAISKWKFRPGMKGGRKVNARMMQPMTINVEEHD